MTEEEILEEYKKKLEEIQKRLDEFIHKLTQEMKENESK